MMRRRVGPWAKPRPQLDLYADHRTLDNWLAVNTGRVALKLRDEGLLPELSLEERRRVCLERLDWS